MSTFVVIGARGGVGQQIVHRLLARDASLVAKLIANPNAIPDPNANPNPACPNLTLTSNQVIAVVRDPSAMTSAWLGTAGRLPDDPRLQIVAGDVTKPDTLGPVLKGAAVVFNVSLYEPSSPAWPSLTLTPLALT